MIQNASLATTAIADAIAVVVTPPQSASEGEGRARVGLLRKERALARKNVPAIRTDEASIHVEQRGLGAASGAPAQIAPAAGFDEQSENVRVLTLKPGHVLADALNGGAVCTESTSAFQTVSLVLVLHEVERSTSSLAFS